jgi:hypothetical protein
MTHNKSLFYLGLLLGVAIILNILILITLNESIALYAYPMVWLIVLMLTFTILLIKKVGDNLLAEIGFIYMCLCFVYTVLPSLTFFIGNLTDNDQLALLLPSNKEITNHMWRHILFMFAFVLGYLLIRGNKNVPDASINSTAVKRDLTISFLIILTAVCITALLLFSGPVNSYYDHYTRYDHLPWLLRKFVSSLIRLNQGFYTILLFFLFLNFKRYKYLVLVVLIAICVHEISYSFGSRIQSLIVLLIALFLYNTYVSKISMKKGAIAGLSLAALFSILELARESGMDLNNLKDSVSSNGVKSASEFGSVFFPGFHLYGERAKGNLPPVEWPMFFNDFISIFTFGDFGLWNPMGWYAKNYYPDSAVAPFTLGPIADSAIWGGEIDLFFRGLLNGILFAWLVKWLIKNISTWWVVCIYTYCYATSILTLKYSVFYHLTPIFKTLLPTILLVSLVKNRIEIKQKKINYLK